MSSSDRISVLVTGLRGIPGVQGGIETHARMLYPLLARLGCKIEVVQRSPYFPRKTRTFWYHGVQLVYVWAPKIPVVETSVHTFLAIVYAAFRRPDILHIHGIGPAFLTPLAKLFRLNVIVTHHTFDYRREKWGRLSRLVFRAGETLGIKFADAVIVVSSDIQAHVRSKYGVEATVIPNGARMPTRASSASGLQAFGIPPHQYVLCVARFESTKRHEDLIDAFDQANTSGWKLVLVGGLQPRDSYVRAMMHRAKSNPDIILTDFQSGMMLREIYSNAGLFVLCSSHEGQPIALLEALSFGIPCLASDIPANRTVPLPAGRLFKVGDVEHLKELIELEITGGGKEVDWHEVREKIRADFDWKTVARKTCEVYRSVDGQVE